MNRIKIREDLLNQYINQTSNMTFKQLEDNYNYMINLLNVVTNEELYSIYLIDKCTGKYLKTRVGGIVYKNKTEALMKAEELNKTQASCTEEYCIERVIKFGITELANNAFSMLKE